MTAAHILTSLAAVLPFEEAEATIELPVDPWVYGATALALFVALLVGVLIWGKGRPHA